MASPLKINGAPADDFFGEGLDPAGGPQAPDAAPADPFAQNAAQNQARTALTSGLNAQGTAATSYGLGTDAQKQGQFDAGNVGGASGAYNAGNATSRAAFDQTHGANGSPAGQTTWNSVLDSPAVKGLRDVVDPVYGASQLGKAALPKSWAPAIDKVGGALNAPVASGLKAIGAPDAVQAIADPLGYGRQTAMGNVSDGSLGPTGLLDVPDRISRSANNVNNDVNNAQGAIAGIPDALSKAMDGIGGGGATVDTSGSDRGGMGLGGAYSAELGGAAAQGANLQAQGQGVLDGTVAPGGAGATQQQDALSAAMGFAGGPRQATGVMGDVNNFMQAPAGPSAAELQLQQGAQGNMADALSLARSGRDRDAGSAARNMNVAMAQNAATGVDTNRDTALLRAKEATDAKAQQLQGLTLKGNLAQGVDTGTLGALGLQSDISSALRSGNVTERGQSLNYDQGQNATGAGLTSDVLKTIPQLEGIRHQDQFDLTPQQKIAVAQIGAVPKKTTADYVTALLGDTLSAL